MKKLLILFIMSLSVSLPLLAQTVNVTATVQDPTAQVFANGTYRMEFVPTFNTPGPFLLNGAPFTTVYTGSMNGSGVFSVSGVADNNVVSPAGSKWNVIACPQASAFCTSTLVTVVAATPNLSAQINANIPNIKVFPALGNLAYNDGEILNPTQGSFYINITTNSFRLYNGSIWTNVGTASAWASGGITSGILCKSNGAGLCLDSSITDSGSTVQTVLPLNLTQAASITNAIIQFNGNPIQGIMFGASTYIGQKVDATTWLATSNNQFNTAQIPSTGLFCWSSATGFGAAVCDLDLGRRNAAIIRLGAADVNGTPVAQGLSVQNAITGANLPGSNFTIFGSNGTGSGGGGSIIFQTATPHGSDSVADTQTTALSMDKNQLVSAPVSFTSPHVAGTTDLKVAGSQALTGVQGTTGTNVFSCTGAFTSGDFVKTDANGNCVDGGSGTGGATLDKQDVVSGINGDSTDHTIYTYSMPSGTLAAGKCLQITFWYQRTAGTGVPVHKVFFGATAVNTSTLSAGSAAGLLGYTTVCNNAASTTAQWGSAWSFDNNGSIGSNITTPAENTNSGSAIVIKGTFNVATGTSVGGKGWIVQMLP